MTERTVFQSDESQKFLIKYVHAPLKFILRRAFSKLPRPTAENTRYKSTKALVKIRDYILEHDITEGYHEVLDPLMNMIIQKNDDDFWYRFRLAKALRKFLELLEAGEWDWEDEKSSDSKRMGWKV